MTRNELSDGFPKSTQQAPRTYYASPRSHTPALRRWFGVPRRTVHYKPTQKLPTVQERFAEPIKQMIEEHPSFGYRTVAHLLEVQQEHGSAHFPADALASA